MHDVTFVDCRYRPGDETTGPDTQSDSLGCRNGAKFDLSTIALFAARF